jgi:hypothetical protein
MASLIAKKKANKLYYYVVESARVDGKPRIVHQTYLGTAEKVAALVKDRTAPVPLEATAADVGLPGALWLAAQRTGVFELLRSLWPEPRSGPSPAHYLLLAAIHRICQPGPKTEVAGWYDRTILRSLWDFPSERFTSQEFWDCFDRIEEEELEKAQIRLLGVWKQKQLVGRRLLAYDTTNFYTYVASTNTRNELAQRGHNKQGRHNLRQVGLSYVMDGDNGLSLCHHVYPGNRADAEELPEALSRIGALLDRNQIARDSVTLVLDKGSAALVNTLELEKAGVGWISALPWNQAPAGLRDRSVEQLPACGSSQPGVRAAAEKLFVHGKEYLCVLKYSACFASEQLNSTTAALTRVTQKLRRLATELSRPQGSLYRVGHSEQDPSLAVGPVRARSAPLRTGTARQSLASDIRGGQQGAPATVDATPGPHRAAHQPRGLDRRTGGFRLLPPAADRTCIPRIKGWRLAGLGTDVPLDRQQDPRACFLLHVGNLAASVCSPPVPERLA